MLDIWSHVQRVPYHFFRHIGCDSFLWILINNMLTGQPVQSNMTNVSLESAFIMAGDNGGQAAERKDDSVYCLPWLLSGKATERMLIMYFGEVILCRGQKKMIQDIRACKAVCESKTFTWWCLYWAHKTCRIFFQTILFILRLQKKKLQCC